MIKHTKCTIELNVDSTYPFVSDKNKINAIECIGETSGGKKIHYFEIKCKDKKGGYFSAWTPNEIFNKFGTYQVIYINQ